LTKTVYGDVDSVYTISNEYTLGSTSTLKPIELYIYADPDKHNVRAAIYARGGIPVGRQSLRFGFDLKVNKRVIYSNAPKVDGDEGDLVPHIRAHSLQGGGGSGREDNKGKNLALVYPDYIQLIEITPNIPDEQTLAAANRAAEMTLSSYSEKSVSIQG